MPRPLFIICSESGAEDKDTGLLSLFGLVQAIQVTKGPRAPQNSPAMNQLRITASWMQESGDESKEFEVEVAVVPPAGEEVFLGRQEFTFEQQFFRMTIRVIGLIPVKTEGLHWVEARVRRLGAKAWLVQKSPLQVELLSSGISEENANSTTKVETLEPPAG
jgi:hypothetical protein